MEVGRWRWGERERSVYPVVERRAWKIRGGERVRKVSERWAVRRT